MVTDWNKGEFKAFRYPWSDEELEDFLGKLNLNQKAVIYATFQL